MKRQTMGGVPVTNDEKAAIIQMRKAGRSLSAIAEETGLSRYTIKTFIRRMRVTADSADDDFPNFEFSFPSEISGVSLYPLCTRVFLFRKNYVVTVDITSKPCYHLPVR